MSKGKITAVLLAAVLSASCVTTPAYALTIQERKEVMTAAGGVSDTMKVILESYIGDEVTAQELYEGAMRGMMDVLDDYSKFYSSEEISQHVNDITGQYYGLGLVVGNSDSGNAVVVRVITDGPSQREGVKAGDVIVEINGTAVTDGMDQAVALLGVESERDVKLVLSRGHETVSINVTKEIVSKESVFLFKPSEALSTATPEDDASIAYVVISEFTRGTAREFKAIARELQDRGIKKLVLDLRGNTGGLMDITLELCNVIVPEGTIITVTTKTGSAESVSSNLQKPTFTNIVVLTDGYTASASEILVSAMKDSGAAVIIGDKTYGKGVGQAMFDAEFDSSVDLTVLEFLSRNGNKINKIGIEPDYYAPMPMYIKGAVELDETGSNPMIADVKAALAYLEYPVGEMNEYYDEITTNSVMEFKISNGLASDAKLDFETISAINMAIYESDRDPALLKALEVLNNQ